MNAGAFLLHLENLNQRIMPDAEPGADMDAMVCWPPSCAGKARCWGSRASISPPAIQLRFLVWIVENRKVVVGVTKEARVPASTAVTCSCYCRCLRRHWALRGRAGLQLHWLAESGELHRKTHLGSDGLNPQE